MRSDTSNVTSTFDICSGHEHCPMFSLVLEFDNEYVAQKIAAYKRRDFSNVGGYGPAETKTCSEMLEKNMKINGRSRPASDLVQAQTSRQDRCISHHVHTADKGKSTFN